jgi:HlyD family secretion protein
MRYAFPLLFIALAIVSMHGCSRREGSNIEASGTIEGTDVNISSEVAGKISAVRVEEGTRVARGDTLALINDADYQLQLQQAEANAAAADAQYRLAVEGSRKEDIIQAESGYKTAEADYLRMKELLANQTITQKQYDDAYNRYVAAQQTYEKTFRGLRKSEIDAARARRDQAAAQANQLRKKVNDCHILAPTDGIITLKAVEPGEFVAVGGNLLRLTYLDKVKLTIYVNEQALGRVRLGQKAEVRIDTEGNKAHEGHVVYISPNAEFTPKNVQTKEERTKLVFGVKIEVDNSDGALKPGLPADATILTARD